MFEISPDGLRDGAHLPALDGLRGLASLSVALGHAPEFGLPSLVCAQMKDLGVFVFFALSGFLIGHLYLDRTPNAPNVSAYLAARICRIVPVYVLVVGLSWLVFRFVDHAFVYAITPIQLLRLLTFNGSVSVFWSIGPEIQFYFFFALLWWIWHRRSGVWRSGVWRSGVWQATSVTLLCCAVAWIYARAIPGILLPSKLHIFAAGVAASIVLHRLAAGPPGPRVLALIQLASIAAIVIAAFPPDFVRNLIYASMLPSDPSFSVFYGNPLRSLLVALVVLSLAFPTRLSILLLGNAPARMLGAVSFSLYLVHDVVYDVLTSLGAQRWLGGPLTTTVAIALSIAVASVSYRLIERPARTRLRRPVERMIENLLGFVSRNEHAWLGGS